MYLTHFKLRAYPFSLTPDTAFFCASPSHSDALNVLEAALRSGEGFIKITGEIGLGKTLLCRILLRKLDQHFVTAYVPDPELSPRGLRLALAEELGLQVSARTSGHHLMRRIRDRLLVHARGRRRVVLLLDEAHQLPPPTLESIRLLTNLETEKEKLLQVLISGQPELDHRLAQPALRQLRQRISFACTLEPLNRDATGVYIAHRMQVAGCTIRGLFSRAAIHAVHRAARGTPRLINILCHKALLAAYGRGAHEVTRTDVRRAIADTPDALSAGDAEQQGGVVLRRFADCLRTLPSISFRETGAR